MSDQDTSTNEEALLDTDGAATLLGVSPRTIQAWVLDRRIPFVKLGVGRRALTRFRPAALREWIAAQEVPAVGKAGASHPANGAQL